MLSFISFDFYKTLNINTYDIATNSFSNSTVLPQNQSFDSIVYEKNEDRFVLAGVSNLTNGTIQDIKTRLFKINPSSLACDYIFKYFNETELVKNASSVYATPSNIIHNTIKNYVFINNATRSNPTVTDGNFSWNLVNKSHIYCKTENLPTMELIELTNKTFIAGVS